MSKGDVTVVTEKFERAALTLALGGTVADAGRAAGVDARTVDAWLARDARMRAALVEHTNARLPAALARMRARLGASLPEILDAHCARAVAGDTASARVVLAIWRALDESTRTHADARVSDAAVVAARAGKYDDVEGEVVEVSVSASSVDEGGVEVVAVS